MIEEDKNRSPLIIIATSMIQKHSTITIYSKNIADNIINLNVSRRETLFPEEYSDVSKWIRPNIIILL